MYSGSTYLTNILYFFVKSVLVQSSKTNASYLDVLLFNAMQYLSVPEVSK